MHDFWTPPLLRRAAPEAKLLVMFRDPIERFRSGVRTAEPQRDARIQAVTADAVERGRYATQLERLRACHDGRGVLVLQYENASPTPPAQYRRTLASSAPTPSHRHVAFDSRAARARRRASTSCGPTWSTACARRSSPRSRELAAMAPEIDLSLWRNFAHLASECALARAVRRRATPGPPDFIGVGAVGAGAAGGSATAARAPRGPPRAGRRALHFFDPFCAREMTDADIAAYHARFPRRPGTISGEWSGRYMCDAWTPPLLRRAAPDAKLLVMVADPIERYRTVFAERLAHRTRRTRLFMTDVAERRRYAAQLDRLHRFFDPDADPRAAVRALPARTRRPSTGARSRSSASRHVVPARVAAQARRGGPRERAAAAARLPERLRREGRAPVDRRGPADTQAAALWPELEDALHTALDDEVEALAAWCRSSICGSGRTSPSRCGRGPRRRRRAPRRARTPPGAAA